MIYRMVVYELVWPTKVQLCKLTRNHEIYIFRYALIFTRLALLVFLLYRLLGIILLSKRLKAAMFESQSRLVT